MDSPPVQDTYGLSCNPDHVELLQTYQPLWLLNESKQSRNFAEYLNKAALHLGFRQKQQDAIDLHVPGFEGLAAAVLKEVLSRGERHAPELYTELADLVYSGVPNILRPVAWPVFLHSEHHCSTEKFIKLVTLLQREFATVMGSSITAQ